MPGANIRGGKKFKKQKKKQPTIDESKIKLTLATTDQVYAMVKRKLGGKRLEVECTDGKVRNAIIPGKMYTKVWMNQYDILLCDLESGKDDLCYIKKKYDNREANMLKSQGKINFDIENNNEDCFEEEIENKQLNLKKIENHQLISSSESNSDADETDE